MPNKAADGSTTDADEGKVKTGNISTGNASAGARLTQGDNMYMLRPLTTILLGLNMFELLYT